MAGSPKFMQSTPNKKVKFKSYVDYSFDVDKGLTTQEKKDVLRINILKQNALSVRSYELGRWKDNIQRQGGAKFKEDVPGRSNLRIPMEGAIVESKTADEIDTMGFPLVIPTESNDIEIANTFQIVFDNVINNVLNLKKTMIDTFFSKNTFGDGLVKVFWATEKQLFRQKGVKNELITVYDDIKVEPIDLRNFIIDPISYNPGKGLSDARYCGFYSMYSLASFKQNFGADPSYKNIDKVTGGKISDNDALFTILEQGDSTNTLYVEVYEHWDLTTDELVIMANNIVIRKTPIPYWNPINKQKKLPIAHFISHIKLDGFWNLGDVDKSKDLVDEYETMRNINLDSAKTYTHPILVVGESNDVDVDDMTLGNGFVWEVDDINQVKQIQMGGNTGLPFNMESATKNDLTRVTGVDIDGILGNPSATATQTLEKKEASLKLIKAMNSYNELNGFIRLYGLIKDLILLKYNKKRITSIVGKDNAGELITVYKKEAKESFKTDYNIMIVPNNEIPASNEIKKVRNTELLSILGQFVGMPGVQEKLVLALDKTLKENLQLSDQEIASAQPQQQPQEAQGQDPALQEALAQSQALGLQPTPEGGGDPKQATAEAQGGTGVQSKIQTRTQALIG